jgi:hypothetical protein
MVRGMPKKNVAILEQITRLYVLNWYAKPRHLQYSLSVSSSTSTVRFRRCWLENSHPVVIELFDVCFLFGR